jgi:hypothetical protein
MRIPIDWRTRIQMWSNEPRQLPEWLENAYEILLAESNTRRGAISHDQAHGLLLAHTEFSDEPADAKYAIERLLSSGWLYEVDDELRITDSGN